MATKKTTSKKEKKRAISEKEKKLLSISVKNTIDEFSERNDIVFYTDGRSSTKNKFINRVIEMYVDIR